MLLPWLSLKDHCLKEFSLLRAHLFLLWQHNLDRRLHTILTVTDRNDQWSEMTIFRFHNFQINTILINMHWPSVLHMMLCFWDRSHLHSIADKQKLTERSKVIPYCYFTFKIIRSTALVWLPLKLGRTCGLEMLNLRSLDSSSSISFCT